MGGVISKAANGIGGVLGNAFVAPLKTILGESCEGVCSGPWDVVGICQCIGRSLCKMCWAACETYWFALEEITCFLWHTLKNTKRINRRRRHRFEDVELGYSSSDESDFSENYRHLNVSRKRKSVRERRKDRFRSSRYRSSRHSSGSHHHHHVQLKTREASVHVKGGFQGLRSSRQLQLSKVRNAQTEAVIFKRRRLR